MYHLILIITMNEEIPDYKKEILEILRAKLNLSNSANITREQNIVDAGLPIMADLVIEDENRMFFIEIKSRVTIDTIARLTLLKEVLQKQKEKK